MSLGSRLKFSAWSPMRDGLEPVPGMQPAVLELLLHATTDGPAPALRTGLGQLPSAFESIWIVPG
jgi:hypothetical protein